MSNILYGTLDPYYNQKVRIYWNFHKKLFSVQARVNGRWKVVRHAAMLNLLYPHFKVSQAGRHRVLLEGRKNVHAFIVGTLVPFEHRTVSEAVDTCALRQVRYNPYKHHDFMVKIDHTTSGEVLGPANLAYPLVAMASIHEGNAAVFAYSYLPMTHGSSAAS
jgi:hypothetical protein